MIANEGRYPGRNFDEAMREFHQEQEKYSRKSFFRKMLIHVLPVFVSVVFERISSQWFLDYFYLSKHELLKLWKAIVFRFFCLSFLFVSVFFFLSFFLKERLLFSIFLLTEVRLCYSLTYFLLYCHAPLLDHKYTIFRKAYNNEKVKNLIRQIKQKYGNK